MYDIKPLEEKWKKYNQKKKKPWYFLGFGILVFLMIILFFIKSNNAVVKNSKNINTLSIEKDPSSLLLNKSLVTLELKKINKQTTVIDSSFNENIVNNSPVITEIKKPVVRKRIRKKVHLNIIETTSQSAYKDVANRFYSSHNIDDSIFLARSYYEQGNYKKAEYWALETNKINNNIEESWLIFAKAKIKQNNRNEAMRILNKYIKRTNSLKAKRLLSKMQ